MGHASITMTFDRYGHLFEDIAADREDMAKIEPRHVIVCDYIAGMTDHFLLRQHDHVFGAAASTVAKNL